MVAKKAVRNPGTREQLEKISQRTKSAAHALRDQLQSVAIGIEERVAIDDHINNISNEMEYMLDSIDSIPKLNQKKNPGRVQKVPERKSGRRRRQA